jgi:N-acetylneuraminic acid mutarotase
MPTYTIYADSTSGWMYQTGANPGASPIYCGYDTTPNFYQLGLAFDTSSVVGTVTSVTLSLRGTNNSLSTVLAFEARLYDWGSTLTTADWQSGSAFGALPLLATFGSGSVSFSTLDAWSSQSAFLTSINQSGFTRMVVSTAAQRLGTQSGVSYIGFYPPANGAGYAPQLVITTTVSVTRSITGQADMAMSTSGTAATTYVAFSGDSGYSAYSRRVSGSVWEEIAVPMPSGGRWELGVGAVGGKLYALGGWSVGNAFISGKLVEAYDPTLNVWTAKANLPEARTGGGVAVVGSYLYYVGGYQPVSNNPHTNLWRYDPAANTWATLAAITPAPANYLTVAIGDPVHNKLYCCENESTTLYIYDIATDAWSTATKPTMLIPMGTWHSNGKAYFFTLVAWTSAPNSLYEYDPVAATFTAKATDPNRYACAMFSFDGQVWVAGGFTVTGPDLSQAVHSFDPATNTWTVRDDLTRPRTSFNGDVLDGHPVVAGGFTPSAPYPTYAISSAERYALPQDSSCEFELDLDPFYPMKLMKGTFDFELDVDGDTRIDPQRMNPGFVHIGHRPVGYRDRTYFHVVASSDLPLPAADASDIWVDGGTQDRAPVWLDEFAYTTSADGRYLYIISGYWWGNSYTWEQWWSNRLYRWDAHDLTWTEMAHLPGYVGSEGCVGGRIGDKIYVLMADTGDDDVQPFGVGGDAPDPEWLGGGTDQLQSMWVYDITGDSWSRGTQPPFAQDYGGCAVLDGKLYAAPQWDGVIPGESPAFYVYDPVADTWTQLADLIDQIDDTPAMWGADGKIWLVSRIWNVWNVIVWSYDPGTDAWTDETANFPGATDVLPGYAPAVLIVSPTVVRLVGGGGGSGPLADDRTTLEIDVVAKTVTDLNIHMLFGDSYFGGTYYNGKMFVVVADDDSNSTNVETD